MTDEEFEAVKQELLAEAAEVDRMNAEVEKMRKLQRKQEYAGLNIFQRAWKMITRKPTLEELIDEFGI